MISLILHTIVVYFWFGLRIAETLERFTTNKNIKMNFFKSSENIKKKEGGPDKSVSDNQFPSVTLNKLAMKALQEKSFAEKSESPMWLCIL